MKSLEPVIDVNMDEKNVLLKLEKDISDYPQRIEKNKKFGIHLNPSTDILKRRVYSKFAMLAKRKDLEPDTLVWMKDFAEKGPFEDIRQYYQNHPWVDQYRSMKNKRA